MLYSHVKQLLSNELLLTQMEKSALMEALVLISNQFKNYERQKLFLEELMAPVVNIWLSEEMCRYRRSWEQLTLTALEENWSISKAVPFWGGV